MVLPADGHVHTEWSWDAPDGSILAESGRALKVNTAGQVYPEIIRWWRDEGGKAITFGSDAHDPAGLAYGLSEAVVVVEAHGFRPGRHPHDFWTRSG